MNIRLSAAALSLVARFLFAAGESPVFVAVSCPHFRTTMQHLLTALRCPLRCHAVRQIANYKAPKPQPPPSPPSLPKPPKKPVNFSLHGESWEDEYNWMSQLSDRVAMRHMDVYMEQEEKYTEAFMSDTDRLQSKLHSEMASCFAADLSTPPLRWGPWLYYRRVEEGMQYPVLCRRLASLHEEFISNKSPRLALISCLERKLRRSCSTTIKKLKDLEVMLMKNYQKSHLMTDILRTLCMTRIMITSNYLLET